VWHYTKKMSFIDVISSFWAPLTGFIALIVWLVRLEGKVNFNEKTLQTHQNWQQLMDEKHQNLDSKIVNELSEIKQSLARLEGKLGIDLHK